MAMSLRVRALETLRRHALAQPGDRVLVALSGGADSVAMLLVLRELERDGHLTVAGAAHLNHQLRGAEADADEGFCDALATRIGVPFLAERADVAARARTGKRSVEDAARAARYEFLHRAAGDLSADWIAVAHTADDQAETFLLRLLRGSGTRGLASIYPRSGRVIRPLLDARREELRVYLGACGQTFREDRTNADVCIPRNRVRHELLPYLASQFSSRVTDVLARDAALARQDEEFLHQKAIDLAARVVLNDVAVKIDVAGLARAPRALSSRVVHAALQRFAGPRTIGFDHVERVLELAGDTGEGRAASLPGQYAVRTGAVVVLRPGRSRNAAGSNPFSFPLSIPGEVEVATHGWSVRAEPGDAAAARQAWAGSGADVGVASDALALPLGVRSRRPGDRFRPLGAPGERKLQDFLVDRKVPRDDRDAMPLVVDGRDRIVWVVGHAVAEDFRVTDASRGVLLLKVRRF